MTFDHTITSFPPDDLGRGCVGAGIDLITACDIRIAATDATFSVKEVNLKTTKTKIPYSNNACPV